MISRLCWFNSLRATLLFTVGGGFVNPILAQDQRPLTALMLRRIAEAVDGNTSGNPVFVVLSLGPANPVLGVFPSQVEAAKLARQVGATAGVFGPYQTLALPTDGVVSACFHRRSVMRRDYCAPPIRTSDIRTISLLVNRINRVDTIPFPPDADAAFLTFSAIDKFAIPYYTRVLGFEAAAGLRKELQEHYASGSRPRP